MRRRWLDLYTGQDEWLEQTQTTTAKKNRRESGIATASLDDNEQSETWDMHSPLSQHFCPVAQSVSDWHFTDWSLQLVRQVPLQHFSDFSSARLQSVLLKQAAVEVSNQIMKTKINANAPILCLCRLRWPQVIWTLKLTFSCFQNSRMCGQLSDPDVTK